MVMFSQDFFGLLLLPLGLFQISGIWGWLGPYLDFHHFCLSHLTADQGELLEVQRLRSCARPTEVDCL